MSALQRCDRLNGNAKHLRCGNGMDIHTTGKGILHHLILGDVCKHAQFDLTIVGIHQHITFCRDEHFADLSAQLRTHGNVLQIRLCGRKTTGSGNQVLEGGADAPILADHIQQAVCIGGLQLGQHAIVHDGRYDGMLVLQLFQHIGIGGITGFGLLNGRKFHLLKQQLTQLFGGIDIKGRIRVGINEALTISNALRKHLSKLQKLLTVDGNAPLLHAIKHTAKRQLDVVIKRRHPLPLQLGTQNAHQIPNSLGTSGGITIIHGGTKEIGSQLGNGIIRLGRVQIVSGQCGIKAHLIPGNAQLSKLMHNTLGIVKIYLLGLGKQITDLENFHGCKHANSLVASNTHRAVSAAVERDFLHIARQIVQTSKRNTRSLHLGQFKLCATQTVFIDQLYELKLLEQLIKLRAVILLHQRILGFKIDGCFGTDGGQVEGKISILLTCFQFLPQLGTDGAVLQIVINTVQRAKFRQKLRCRLGTHTGNAGNIIRAVAHQRLQIDHHFWCKAVFLTELRLIIKGRRGLTGLGNDQLYMDILVDQLQAVTVTGNDNALPAVI